MALLGIDVGTSHCKAVAFHEDGREVAIAIEDTITHHEPNGRAWYDPEELWETVAQAIRHVLGRLPCGENIHSVAVASMAEAGLLVDRAGRALSPIIAWFDPRTEPQVEFWKMRGLASEVEAITGLTMQAKFSLNKIMWLMEHMRDAWDRVHKWLNVADFIAFRLSGVMATDFSLATRTMAFDLAQGTWSEKILSHAGVDVEIFPQLYESGTIMGAVTRVSASETGLDAGTPVVMGGHDHLCGALGAGAVEPGILTDSMGTAEALLLPTGTPVLSENARDAGTNSGRHIIPGFFYIMASLQSSGASVEWLMNLFDEKTPGGEEDAVSRHRSEYQEWIEKSQTNASASPVSGLLYFPYLWGGAPPYPDPAFSGAFLGLRSWHNRYDLYRAVLEGTACQSRLLAGALSKLSGEQYREIRVIGGGARNPLWLDIKAAIFNRPLIIPEGQELVAKGAALLAGVGIGVYPDVVDACRQTNRIARVVEPDRDKADIYDTFYREVYVRALSNLSPAFKGLGAFASKI